MFVSAFALTLLPALAQAGPMTHDPIDARAPVVNRVEFVRELRDLMLAGIETTSPSQSFVLRLGEEDSAPPSLFDGSYDWHSCVFAHWALLVIARTTGDDELSRRVAGALGPSALDRERGYLDAVPVARRATAPYDRAWLLRLVAELERHRPGDREPLRTLRTTLEDELLTWLEGNAFPENPERDPEVLGGRPFVGFYRSWLFAWLQVALSGPTGEGHADRLEALRIERILPARPALAEHTDWFGYDFLWMPSLQVLVEDLSVPALAPLPFRPGEPIPIPDGLTTRNVHPLGIEVGRLWGWGALAARGDEGAAREFDRHLALIVERPELWREDFAAVTHWVPQFLFVACWLRDGRP